MNQYRVTRRVGAGVESTELVSATSFTTVDDVVRFYNGEFETVPGATATRAVVIAIFPTKRLASVVLAHTEPQDDQ